MQEKRHGVLRYFIIGAVVFFLLCGSVLGNLQINDLQIYSSDSGLKLDVISEWLDLQNISNKWLDVSNDVNVTGELTVSGHIDTNNINLNYLDVATMDNTSKMIRCSNGNVYTATFANLQTAISTENMIVWIPTCNISVTATLRPANGVQMIGLGNASILYLADNVNDYVIAVENKENIVLDGLHIQCNGENQNNYYNGAINITNQSSFITIKNCNLTDSRGNMIYMGSNPNIKAVKSHDNTIMNNYLCNVVMPLGGGLYPSGIRINGYNNRICNNFIKDTYQGGIYIESDDIQVVGDHTGYRNIVSGNILTGRMDVGIADEVKATSAFCKGSNSSITNNIIYNLSGIAGKVGGIQLGENSVADGNIISHIPNNGIYVHGSNAVISNNIINNITNYSSSRVGGDTEYAIETTSTAGYCTIIGNSINESNDSAIYCASPFTIINSNNINECHSYYGIYLISSADYSTVSDNMFLNQIYSFIGIYGPGCDNISVHDNVFINCSSVNGAVLVRSSENATISDNIFIGCNAGIVEMDSGGTCNNNYFHDNNLMGCTTKITQTGKNTVIKDNIGYKTEEYGVFYDADDGETINHNLTTTPSGVIATCNMSGVTVAITAIAATTFTIDLTYHDGVARNDLVVYWYAFYKKDV